MYGRLNKIKITNKLIELIAMNKFYQSISNDDFVWNDLSDMDKGIWLNSAVESLNNFNDLSEILNRIGYKLQVN